ncbi:hypothetical protein G7077_03330 [Sphingomonas piscis]|uniref:Glycosyltransferase n=1 Tax=Sphingomonas piscis TaxID=2714943 RepID=A0A6G7YMX2_9SPHN|nr:hypothetical protein [Sphingomonas piscis]QIK78088.1 hypothetical protein G7077_03330 [Sphingomonas piscis]
MKLIVLVPSRNYQSSAGARVRYGRLAAGLQAHGIFLQLQPINDFNPLIADFDALVISKCHDARSLLAAAAASGRGKLVGVDLFDDYFSQHADSRLLRYRDWLRAILQDCHFALCSTPPLAEVTRQYSPDLPVHVVNDPAPSQSVWEILSLADRKAEEASRTGAIRACWFGVGDNPHFEIGLADLSAHSSAVLELSQAVKVELSVLTNRRALDADGLDMLAGLPIDLTLLEWSETAEQEVLQRADLAFLPVSPALFSRAKSLNRAFTSLAFGCQILSVGHPLYEALDPLIYRDPAVYLADLRAGTLRLSVTRKDEYCRHLEELGSEDTEAVRLSSFLATLEPPQLKKEQPRICVVHGMATRAEVHNFTAGIGGLSVASPYCSAELDFDVDFRRVPLGEAFLGSERRRGFRRFWRRRADDRPAGFPKNDRGAPSVAFEMATYGHTMRQIATRLAEMLGPVRIILSETARIPVSLTEAGQDG